MLDATSNTPLRLSLSNPTATARSSTPANTELTPEAPATFSQEQYQKIRAKQQQLAELQADLDKLEAEKP